MLRLPKNARLLTLLLATLLLLAWTTCASAASSANKPVVASGTSLISSIISEIAGDKVTVVNIMPPTSCPGHYDLKAKDIKKLTTAQIFFLHGWQKSTFDEKVLKAANNPNLKQVFLNIDGNWMTPPVRKKAIDAIVAELCKFDPKNAAAYQQKASQVKAQIDKAEKGWLQKLQAVNKGKPAVLSANYQKGIMLWAGFDVVGSYDRPEDMTPAKIKELVQIGREKKVCLVVDNLQSGPDAGKPVASELKVPRITLSNFPGAFKSSNSWQKEMDSNVQLIIKALSKK